MIANRQVLSNRRSYILALMLTGLASSALALPITQGNLLISSNEVVYEYTMTGSQVQHFDIEYPGGAYPNTEGARDLAFHKGQTFVYNGSFDPYLSIHDGNNGSWSHSTLPGWSTINNGTYGGIDTTDDYIFVTDMATAGDDGADVATGVIRYNLDGSGGARFATELEPIDLTVGLDGLLYVLHPGGSQRGRDIDVYDPVSLALVKQIDLVDVFGRGPHRSLAVDHNGDLFFADWEGDVHHVSANGVLVDTIFPECDSLGFVMNCNFFDIDISEFGLLALGGRFGEYFITDTSFSSISKFDVGTREGVFVEFAVPAPSTLVLMIVTVLSWIACGFVTSSRAPINLRSGSEVGH